MTTNREQLNQMSNEELADILANDVCLCCIYRDVHCEFDDDCECTVGITKWLNQESEE